MLTFAIRTLNTGAASALRDRFVVVVNRLLPQGWRFSVSETPQLVHLPIGPAGPLVLAQVLGEARLDRWDQFGTMETHSQAWQRRFRECLSELIADGRQALFILVGDDPSGDSVWYDEFASRRLDVGDLEYTQPSDAALALIHASEECIQRSGDLTQDLHNFPALHGNAIRGMEARVAGGRIRREDLSGSRPAGINPVGAMPRQSYEYWVPYVRAGDSFVLVMVLRMRGTMVLGARQAGFPSIEAYQEALHR